MHDSELFVHLHPAKSLHVFLVASVGQLGLGVGSPEGDALGWSEGDTLGSPEGDALGERDTLG